MAFAGSSRTINETLSRSRSVGVSSAFEFSQSEWASTMSDLDKFYEDVLIQNAPIRMCFKLDLLNNVPIEPLRLQSKENRGIVRKAADKVRGCVYVNHSIIYLVYIPSILESSTGVLTLKLFNTNTGEIIDIDTDAPAQEAAIFVTRWPRSLHVTEGKGLMLLPSVNVTGCKQGAIVGTLYPMWDDSFSRKKAYEREYPSLRFPIELTDARSAVTDVKLLKGFTMQRVIGGGTSTDIKPEVVHVRSEPGKKAKTAVFKRVSTGLRAGRPSSVSDDILNTGVSAEGSTIPVNSDDEFDKFKKKKFKEGYTSEDC
uniref:Movement protein n=1 Tax=Fragaria chiloensis latent virus TaxID=255238 RepID=A0A0S2N095_9BROM|nr:movement protein [Fragaria chiloensis latent virus]